MTLRPLVYEPSELPSCSPPRRHEPLYATPRGGANAGQPLGEGAGDGAAPLADGAGVPPGGAPGGGGPPDQAALDEAVAAIDSALEALAQAQRDGDFEAIGRAQADLQDAVQAFEEAQQGDGATPSPTD